MNVNLVDASNSKTTIVLVHGTWGNLRLPLISNKTFWYDEGSVFRSELSSRLEALHVPFEFCVFRWSGSNSILERDKWSRKLSEEIDKCLEGNACQRIVIIAHSHGGNLAARALDRCKQNTAHIRVSFLATPFIEIFPRRLVFGEKFVASISVTAISMSLSSVIFSAYYKMPLALAAQAGSLISPEYDMLMFSSFLFGLWYYRRLRSTWRLRKTGELIDCSKKIRLIADKNRIMILRSVDDEATLAIGAGAFANFFTNKISYVLAFALPIWYFGISSLLTRYFHTGFIGRIEDLSEDQLKQLARSFSFNIVTVPAVTLYFIIAISLVLLLSLAGRSTYGRELFLCPPGMQINLQNVPDRLANSLIVTLLRVKKQKFMAVRHSIYNHPRAVEKIADWIKGIMQHD